MKIALLTLAPSHNYGGILQAIALYSYLESQGHDVTLVNKNLYFPLWKKMVIKILEKMPFQNIKSKKYEAVKTRQLKSFVEKHLPKISRPIFSQREFQQLIEDERFDAVIVGSDQVWRYQYINDGFYSVYFLDFQASFPVKKIAYAASFGKDSWQGPPQEIIRVSKLLKKFDAVSVRETEGVEVCDKTFGIQTCEQVLDPTMLVEPKFYDPIINAFSGDSIQGRRLVTYVLDKSKEKRATITVIKQYLEEVDQEKFVQVDLDGKINGKYRSVEEWLWQIKNADFVVTDSFHGMVFSILFQKQFLVTGNAYRGLSRFSSLLKSLRLLERLYTNNSDEKVIGKIINYELVTARLETLRQKSQQFLQRSIG